MAGELYPVSGMKIYIGGVLASKSTDFVEADFAGQSWVEIDGWETVGAFGDNSEVVTFQLVNRGRDLKQKGTANAGTMQNVFAHLVDDQGQIDLVQASAPTNKNNYAIRVDLNDTPSGGGTPSKRYFIGLVMSAEEAGGGANDPRRLNATVEINSNIVRVAAIAS